MPQLKTLILLIGHVLFVANLQAQTFLNGVVTNSLHTPIPYASVYLSQTTFGTMTREDGSFSLNTPGEGTYELIFSCLGYQSVKRIIQLNHFAQQINIQLTERPVLVKEVTVKDKYKNRTKNYELFVKYFIGKSTNSPYTTIGNRKDLIAFRDTEGKYLIAYSRKPLIITNSALGYQIIYDLKYFKYEFSNEHLRFSGDYYFKDISNQKRANSRTNRNRLIAYYGSRMHFLRSLFTDSLEQQGFEICNIQTDSCGQKILTQSMQAKTLRLSCQTDCMNLYHFTPIYINYTDKHPELYPLPYIYYQITYNSSMTFNDTVKVYKNGYYPSVYNISWSGSMAADRIAEMLPYDFVPMPYGKNKQSVPGY